MKLKIFVAVLAVALAWFAGRHYYRTGHVIGGDADAQSFAEKVTSGEQVINDSYALSPGARVEVSGINGPVEIATADIATAEIHVENNVSDARELENHRVTVDRAADHLTVRAENRSDGGAEFLRWLVGRGGGNFRATQRVVLKVPRQVTVAVRGVNGEVKIGEVEGAVRVSSVNGAVTVGRAAGRADVSSVNGNVTFAMSRLADEGVRVSGVNGNIELRLASDVNAELRVGGLSGGVTYDLNNVTVEGEGDDRSKLSARIGAGGAPIRISGIHGDVHLAYI